MLIDGEKWACEACVRGHRVSSCHHSDRPLTHINKKGRPISQCVHCRGLRKSRTTHVKCECGDKKKTGPKTDSDPHAGEQSDLKHESRHQCNCNLGQRCTCALKKEHHLQTVPETGLPPSQPLTPTDLKKPHQTTMKLDGTFTMFRDGHHKPAHKYNDMAHKCGMPYTIPRSHTIHSTDVARRSADYLPLANLDENTTKCLEQSVKVPPRLVKSEHGSPENGPIRTLEGLPASIPPLELSSYLDTLTSARMPALKNSGGSVEPEPAPAAYDKVSLEQIITSIPSVNPSSFSFPATAPSPVACMAVQDAYGDAYRAAPDADFSLLSAGISAPPVDWSSFPLYASDVPAATSTQTPSYSSFDLNSLPHGFPAPSSSGDMSEVEDLGTFAGVGSVGSDFPDLRSVSGNSEMEYRISSASSFIGLPQAQLLSSNLLESINIDDFLNSTIESTAALEHQLQASMGVEVSKPLPVQGRFEIPQGATYESFPADVSNLRMNTSPTEPTWPSNIFESDPVSLNTNYYHQSWA